MVDFRVVSKSLVFLLICCFFFSCSSTRIKINKNKNSNQWFVLDLKESKIYFNINDVLENLPKKSLENRDFMEIYERIRNSKDTILVVKDFFYKDLNVSKKEALNFVVLSESMLNLFKKGKLKVYDKKKLVFVDVIILKKFKPRFGSFGYDIFLEDKIKIYSIFIGFSE